MISSISKQYDTFAKYGKDLIKMNISKITEVQMQIIINNSLYKKNIIDESTFSKANETLLRNLKRLKTV